MQEDKHVITLAIIHGIYFIIGFILAVVSFADESLTILLNNFGYILMLSIALFFFGWGFYLYDMHDEQKGKIVLAITGSINLLLMIIVIATNIEGNPILELEKDHNDEIIITPYFAGLLAVWFSGACNLFGGVFLHYYLWKNEKDFKTYLLMAIIFPILSLTTLLIVISVVGILMFYGIYKLIKYLLKESLGGTSSGPSSNGGSKQSSRWQRESIDFTYTTRPNSSPGHVDIDITATATFVDQYGNRRTETKRTSLWRIIDIYAHSEAEKAARRLF